MPIIIKASVAAHVAAGAAVAVVPGAWPWAAAVIAADHLLLTGLGLWPRSTALGPNMHRLPADAARRGEIALTIDDGPEPEVTPAVLDLLDAHGAKATFFCIAEQAGRHPALCREIVRRGHAVENHSRHHSHRFSLLGPAGLRREIAAAQQILGDLTGVAPRYFRAPAGLRNPLLDPVLHGLGLELVSWTRRAYDTRQHRAPRVLAVLGDRLTAGDILLLHDGNAARTEHGQPVLLEVLPDLLQRAANRGLTAVTLAQACHT
jgi:peptidoglycan/xylan/chitin deacetylase (PgdA/CDA1 family)